MTEPDIRDECSGLVTGDFDGDIDLFLRSAALIIREEQGKPSPDNHLVGFVCDAVRIARDRCPESLRIER